MKPRFAAASRRQRPAEQYIHPLLTGRLEKIHERRYIIRRCHKIR
jgi:hypothetical protein